MPPLKATTLSATGGTDDAGSIQRGMSVEDLSNKFNDFANELVAAASRRSLLPSSKSARLAYVRCTRCEAASQFIRQ